MDPLRLCLALGPLALYLLLLGIINLSKRPFLISGSRDLAALGVAVSGLILVGPIELLLPEEAIQAYRGYVWLLLGAMYGLCLSLVVLVARPRLILYNMSADELRPVLAQAIDALDPEARWAGSSLSLPRLRVELHMESSPAMRTVSLVASGEQQSFSGWRQLELALAVRLKRAESSPNPWGVVLSLASVMMIGTLTWHLASRGQEITQAFRDMMRI